MFQCFNTGSVPQSSKLPGKHTVTQVSDVYPPQNSRNMRMASVLRALVSKFLLVISSPCKSSPLPAWYQDIHINCVLWFHSLTWQSVSESPAQPLTRAHCCPALTRPPGPRRWSWCLYICTVITGFVSGEHDARHPEAGHRCDRVRVCRHLPQVRQS